MMAGRGRRTLSVVRGLAEGLAGNIAGGFADPPARLLRSQAPPAPEPQAILAALATAVVVVDRQGRFRFANQAAEEFFALSSTSLRATRLAELVPEDSPLFALITQVLAGAVSVSDYDLAIESPRLSKRGITVHGAPVPEAADCVALTLIDGSTPQKLEKQMGFRNAARSVTGMAAILAHEVKNPLSGIRGAAQLLESSVSEADRELTQLIQDEADRIRALVDRMETFSERPIERGEVNIHQVLEHVRRLAQSGFARHVRFVETYDPSLPPVWGNRDQLIQVVLNLVKNAAEAVAEVPGNGPSGTIELATAYQHGVRLAVPGATKRLHLPLVVSVKDTGHGIPESLRPNLFDPFVTTKRQGSGLGLALVAKIIGDHGGLVECDSAPGRTVFRLHLPVHPGGGARAGQDHDQDRDQHHDQDNDEA
ncbi:nitrogen regulation protein NR(II) [Elioraea sp.]|uniref:two-component system sensor histidine kinase NtrB n=1 Tax=Elioraea sp. TaxID=2185103 RepID=UPI0025C27D4B|nr:ATP-binding protein [Elioraea sp.]